MGVQTAFNVLDYGADPRGAGDSSRAIQTAINHAIDAGGGIVFFPDGTYLCQRRLRADSSVGLMLAGVGSETSGREAAATVRYTGRPGPFISARSTQRFSLRGLGIFTDHPDFTGVVVDLSQSRDLPPADSAFALIEDCVIMGGRLLINASALISLDRAIVSTIRNCNLGNAQTAIIGAADENSWSNVIQVLGCHLTNTAEAPIRNPGDAWLVEGCSFAPRNGGLAGAIDCGIPARALSVIGCWMGDVTSGSESTWLRLSGGGFHIAGNSIGGDSGTTAIAFAGDANSAIDIRANLFESHAVGVDMGLGQAAMVIAANIFADVAMPIAGTPSPSTTIQDDVGCGIGRDPSTTLSVGQALHVGPGTPTSVGNARFEPAGGSPVSFRTAFGTDGSGWQYRVAANDPVGGVQDLVAVQDDGNVGLGVMTPTFRLHLLDDSAAKPGTSTWSTPSDERLKDPSSVEAFHDGLDVARSLRPVRYRYNGKAGLPAADHIGVIAQEARKAMPYAVQRYRARMEPDDGEETELLAFNPHALQFVLVNAVKELEARIRTLEQSAAGSDVQPSLVPPPRE